MGKQGRRKQRQRRKQQQQQEQHATVDTTSTTSSSSAVMRLRHADPKIRHAALIALQTTAFRTEVKHGNDVVSLPVLQAVREQVMDNDLECAAKAAECLTLYLSNSSSMVMPQQSRREEATASWVILLLRRLEQCYASFLSEMKPSDYTQKLNKKRVKAWLAVAAPCCNALCLLIERNESALEQILLQRKKCCQVILGLLELMHMWKLQEDGSTDSAAPVNLGNVAIADSLVTNTALYAVRSLHSALDENYELVETASMCLLPEEKQSQWKCWLETNNGDGRSSMVSLHIIGSLVNMYQLTEQGQPERTALEELLLLHAVAPSVSVPVVAAVSPTPPHRSDSREGVLMRILHSFDCSHLRSLQSEYHAALQLYESQKRDQKMEEEIIQKVNNRKEPAKEIARRQKKQQQEEAMTRITSQGDVEMEDADGVEVPSRGKFMKREKEGESAIDEVLSKWIDKIEPLQLALEVLANLVTCWIPRDDEMIMHEGVPAKTKPNGRLQLTLQEQRIGPEIAQLLQSLCQHRCRGEFFTSSDTPLRRDVDEAIDRTCACLSNCVLSKILNPSDFDVTWQKLRDCLRLVSSSGTSLEGITSTMVVLVRQQPTLIENQDLEIFHTLLSLGNGSETIRNATCILSTAIALPNSQYSLTHSEPAIRKFTQSFLEVLLWERVNLKTALDVLNAFMDWYGQDEFHPHVYEDLKISSAIQMYLGKLQESPVLMTPEEEEILHNVEQFLDYKQRHLLER